MEHFEILVIGGGPAAISLVRTLGAAKSCAVIRPEDHSLIYCAMPYVIETLIPMGKIFKKDELVTDTGAVLLRDSVTAVDFADKTVRTASGARYTYENLVIATGAQPIRPSLPGSDLAGVFTFKTEEDLRAILGVIEAGARRAVVVGAGAIGVELAQALNARGVDTHLVDIAPHILPNMADPEIVREAEEYLIDTGLKLHLAHSVTALQGKTVVEEVLLDRGEPIRFLPLDDSSANDRQDGLRGIVVFAVGMRPVTALFAGSDLVVDRAGIVINNRMETNIPHVYAVGDCAHFVSGITGEFYPGKLATNAVPMGKMLGRILLGEDISYRGFYNGAATKVGRWFIGGTGFTEEQARRRFTVRIGYAELATAFPIMPTSKKSRVKLIVDGITDLVVGGQILSGEPVCDKIDQITMAIQWKISVKELSELSYSAQPYQSFYPADNLIVLAARNAETGTSGCPTHR